MTEREEEALRAELARLRGSLRYRAADMVAEAFASPAGLLRAPRRMAGLYAEVRAVRAWRRVVTALECGLPNDSLRTAPVPPLSSSRAVLRAAENDGRPAGSPATASRMRELRELIEEGGLLPPCVAADDRLPDGPIAYVAHAGLPDASNGYAVRTHALVRAMRDEGASVTVFLRGGVPGEVSLIDGVPYRRLGFPASNASYVQTVHAYAEAIRTQLLAVEAAWVHAASNHVTGQAAGLAARGVGLPFTYEARGLWEVTRLNGEPGYQGSLGYRAQRALEEGTARAAHRVFVNGGPLRSLFAAAGIAEERLRLLPNGCDAAPLPSAADRLAAKASFGLADRPVIGFAGSLTAYEGLDAVIAATAALPPAVQLLIVGDGPERARLEIAAHRVGLG